MLTCLSNFLPSFVLMRTKLMQKLNRNLTEEENATQCLKILTQITIKDENELAEIREVFPKNINTGAHPSTMTTNLP